MIFGLLARFYTERQTKNQLIKDANTIYNVIVETEAMNKDITSALARQELRKKIIAKIGGLESNFTLISRNLRIIYPRNEDALQFKEQVLPRIESRLEINNKKIVFMKLNIDNQECMFVILPPKVNVSASLRGWVVLYNVVGPIQKLTKSMLLVLLISLLITAVIAIIAGAIVARTIAKPIIILKNRAEALSRLDFNGKAEIRTGDELEELGKAMDKMADDLKEHDMAQKRFIQNASHELKTPLMSIQGYAEGLKDGVFEDGSEALDIIVEESKRLKGIVEELVFLTKMEFQEELYKYSIESMNDIIDNSISKMKGLASADKININMIPFKEAMLRIDRERITQALINIIGNCLRYAKREVNIAASCTGKWFEIKIWDDGSGFEGDEAAKIFERFYKGKNGDSGLGLAITKAIIEKHNGLIEAYNNPGGGAEFHIKLPFDSSK